MKLDSLWTHRETMLCLPRMAKVSRGLVVINIDTLEMYCTQIERKSETTIAAVPKRHTTFFYKFYAAKRHEMLPFWNSRRYLTECVVHSDCRCLTFSSCQSVTRNVQSSAKPNAVFTLTDSKNQRRYGLYGTNNSYNRLVDPLWELAPPGKSWIRHWLLPSLWHKLTVK